MSRFESSLLLILLVMIIIVQSVGCGRSYKNWAIEQTYGQVPCASLTVDDIFDDTDVPALGDAPVNAWIVSCNQRAYLCSYRKEEAGWVHRLNWGRMTVDEERMCIPLDDPPAQVKAKLAARSAPVP